MPVPSSDVRHLIERIADAFEEAWLAGSKPRIESFLKDAGDARREALVELAFTDLEYRLRAGETKIVEDLGQRFPELKVDPDLWRGLIVEERHQRQRLGQKPTKDEYRQRFPEQASKLDTVFGDADSRNLPTRAYTAGGKLPAIGPRYRAQRIVAEGGMGYVARIVDVEFDRPLAMKVLAEKLKGNTDLEDRFLREARLTGQLQHPGIPPVQEKGRLEDGTPYFIMKLIKGHSLQKLLRDRSSPQERVGYFVGVFESICQTLAYAHSRGIIHRDLKPGNIMVGSFGEVQVMDWGLAKVLRSDAQSGQHATATTGEDSSTLHIVQNQTSAGQHTIAGSIMGTPGYMAPEQARGEIDALDQRCDVFGLGSILCDVLTGLPPFAPSGGLSSQRLAMTGDLSAAFARLDQSGADVELIALAKRCLAPEKADRPADARAVADAIAQYLAHVQDRLKQSELEQARLITKAEQDKARRRDRRIAAGCIALLLLGGFFAWQWYRGRVAEAETSRSRTAAEQLVHQLDNAIALAGYGFESLKTGALEDSQKTLDQSRHVADDARANKAPLSDADARLVKAKFDEYATTAATVERNFQFAKQLETAFEARARQKESDFDVQFKKAVVLGREGPKLYRKAFADYGVTMPPADPAAAAKQLEGFPARRELGLAFVDWINFERTSPAAKELAAVADLVDPDPARARLRKGVLAGDAVELGDLSLKIDVTQSPRLVVLLADALNNLNRTTEAVNLLNRAHDETPGDFWINQSLGTLHLAEAGIDKPHAIARFESAYVLRPTEPFVTVNLAQALCAAGRHEQAAKLCRRFLSAKNDPRVAAVLAEALVANHDFAEADKALRTALDADSRSPKSGFLDASKAASLNGQGKHQEAGELAKSTLESYPNFYHALVPLGYAHLQLHEPKFALEIGEHLAGWKPRAVAGHDLAARALLKRYAADRAPADLRKAEEYAATALRCDSDDPQAYETMGDVLLAKGDDTDAAFVAFKNAADRTAYPLPHFKGRARQLAKPNHYPEAEWLFAEIVSRDPRDKEAWDGLVGALGKTGRVDDVRRRLPPIVAKLAPEQLKRLDGIPLPDNRPVNSAAILARPINVQQAAPQQGSAKRNRK